MSETLNLALKNLLDNKAKVDKALADSEMIVGTFTPDVLNAFQLILHTFQGNVQIASQMLKAIADQDKLSGIAGEIGIIVAAAQVVLGDESLIEAAQAKATANTEVAGNPLSDAAGSGQLSAANDSASTDAGETAPAPAETSPV